MRKVMYVKEMDYMGKITLSELSAMLGVSKSAISMALNHRPGISDATREEIIRVATDSGYLQQKSKPSNGIISIIYINHTAKTNNDLIFSSMLEAFNSEAVKAHYSINIRFFSEGQKCTINDVQGSKGLIILGPAIFPDDLEIFLAFKKPVVVVDHDFPELQINTVSVDNSGGIWSAVLCFLLRSKKMKTGNINSAILMMLPLS